MNIKEIIREKKLKSDQIELELAQLKLKLVKQKEGWVLEKKFVALADRLELESKIASKQVELSKIKKELRELKGAPGTQLEVETLWKAIKEILIERGLEDIIEEARERANGRLNWA